MLKMEEQLRRKMEENKIFREEKKSLMSIEPNTLGL